MANWAGGVSGAAGGASLGATLGAIFGPIGTAIGTVLGTLGGGAAGLWGGSAENAGKTGNEVFDYLFGTPEGLQMLNQFSPEQQKQLHELLNQGMNQYQNQYAGFEPIRQREINSFNQEIVPGIAERFSASGRNALSSGALQSQLSGAGSDLSQRLAAMQSEYGMKNRDQALNAMRLGLQPMYARGVEQPARPGLLGRPEVTKNIASALSAYAGAGKGQGFNAFNQSLANSWK